MTKTTTQNRPTLVRRVILTLLAASVLVWLVLMAFYYWQESGPHAVDARQRQRGEAVLLVLSQIKDPAQAHQAVSLYTALFNSLYQRAGLPQRFLVQLTDRQGQSLFSTMPAGTLTLSGESGEVVTGTLNGARYQLFRGETSDWRLLLGEPAAPAGLLLARISSNLTISVLIAVPLFLLPVWFAVTRGLRPLRRLSAAIAARGPDDLTPLALDVTYAELTPLTNALDRLFSQLRARIAREHGFVQDAAHELRTPIAVIAAQAHVMQRAEHANARNDAATHLDAAIARMSHLIEQLLDLARIDAGNPTAATLLDVAQLLRQELANAAPAAMARQIELSLEAPEQLSLRLDPQALLSIVQNLLSNALRYIQDGGEVAVELSQHQGRLRLAVADNGPGIAPAEQALVFERFYRVAGTDVAGSGLGLAIVTEAVARLRGTVRLEQGLQGRGCCFIVEIPVG